MSTGRESAVRRSALQLTVVVFAMFGFGYALVPLYDIFCEVTGLNGKTGVVQAADLDGVVDTSRMVTVEFLANVNSSQPWQVEPVVATMQVYPGKLYETHYFARNLTQTKTAGEAVPSVSPGEASRYFNKVECFCFTRQDFEAGEGREMPVRFIIDRRLPPEVSVVTLSYTFYGVDADAQSAASATQISSGRRG